MTLRFLIFLALGFTLRFITQHAPTPELSQNLWFALPAFGVFVLFVLSACSWGSFLRTKINYSFFSNSEEALFDLSVGSVGMYLLAYALTPLGLFSSANGIILWVVLGIGFTLGFPSLHMKKWFDFGSHWYSKLFMALVPLIVLVKLIEGVQFHQHGDSYVTYLVGPRTWGESGNFQGFLRYSQLFLSTSWESLYAWGTALMGFRGGAGLDISQWFSQWVTGGIGVLGSLLLGLALCKRLAMSFPLSTAWYPVIAIVSLQAQALRWTQNLAKNDYGIIFWGMSAFYFSIYGAVASPAIAFMAGLLTGAAVVGKMTVVILGGLLSFFILLKARKNSIPFIIGGIMGSVPVFLRNFILTNNPVFPWLPKIFPSPYLSDFAENGANAATQKSFLITDLWEYSREIYQEIPLFMSIFLIFLFSKYRKKAFELLLIPVISFVIFTLTLRPSTGIRYQNATLILLSVFAVYFTFFILDQWSQKILKNRKTLVLLALSFVLLGMANLTFFTLFQIGSGKKFCTFSKRMVGTNEIGGPAKVWIRSNIKPTESIISFGDVHIYYLIDYPLTEVGQSVEYGKKIFHSTLDEAEALFKHAPFDYLYLAGEDYYKDAAFAQDQAKIGDIMKRANAWDAKCKRFDNTKAQVWDLKCLN